MIDEIKGDVQSAITELRALAHGIFPPLLVSGGLSEALPAAAGRCPLPTRCRARRRGPLRQRDRGSRVLLRARGAPERRQARRRRRHGDGPRDATPAATLRFEDQRRRRRLRVPRHRRRCGHGFVNMADRLGAFGGTVTRRPAPGAGTTITGTIPLPDDPSAERSRCGCRAFRDRSLLPDADNDPPKPRTDRRDDGRRRHRRRADTDDRRRTASHLHRARPVHRRLEQEFDALVTPREWWPTERTRSWRCRVSRRSDR